MYNLDPNKIHLHFKQVKTVLKFSSIISTQQAQNIALLP